jgi:asparagine synthase (glutamine-hydrolysing)
MCGIVAVFRRDGAPVVADDLAAMRDSMTHRGPDDCGLYLDGPVGLGHRRLSIIDLGGGHQPMANERGTAHVVFNGEIYNYRELRALLQARGMRLRTHSDTETILGLYDLYGTDCVQHLRGMFAFVLWDAERRRMVAARDRLGIKPLYLLRDGSTVAFASEVKAFLSLPGWAPELRVEAVGEYLAYRNLAGRTTLLRDVERVEPGETVEITASGERRSRYWTLPVPDGQATRVRSVDDWVDELEELLRAVVVQHMVSDVPLGAFLSGGVDSSVVTALATVAAGEPLHTFSIGFAEPDFDERPFADAVAQHLSTRHRSFVISEREYTDALPEAIWHADEPLSHPHMAHFLHLSRFARERVTVVLTGEGSDELFAGYPRYRLLQALEHVPLPAAWTGPLLRLAATGLGGRSALRTRALADGAGGIHLGGLAAFVGPADVRAIIGPHAGAMLRREDPRAVGEPLLARALLLDQQTYLQALLERLDKMTMSASLEARVPFLDHKVVEFAARVPLGLKLRRFETKHLVKRLARRHVPAQVVDRPKKGFAVPIASWMRNGGPLGAHLDLLLEPTARTGAYLDRARVHMTVAQHRSGARDHAELLWGLMNLELWHRIVIEGAHKSSIRPAAAPATLRSA